MVQFSELPSTFLKRFKKLRDKFEKEKSRSKMSPEECEECLVCFEDMYATAKNILDDIERKEIDHGNDSIYFYGFEREYLGNVFDLVPESVTKDLLYQSSQDLSDLYIACLRLVPKSPKLHSYRLNMNLFAKSNSLEKMPIAPTVTSYLTLGKSVGKSEEISQFKNLVAKIYNNVNLAQVPKVLTILPFIYFCGSSGTGKTQIPFSLPHADEFPFIYLLQNPSDDMGQPIYHQFIDVSKAFENYVAKDYKSYTKQFKGLNSVKKIYQCSEILQHKK